jgi:mono/diheme cytochrome c family protein
MRSAPLVVFCLLSLMGAAGAASFGDKDRGSRLAQTWCNSCHLVDAKKGGVTRSGVPPFTVLAKRLADKKERRRIENWLIKPHGAMSSFSLSNQDIADLISYIRTLDPAPRN